MKSVLFRLQALFDKFIFFLRYPYASPERIYGLSFMKLPFLFRGGKRVRLTVEGSSLKADKNIEIQPQVWLGYDVEISSSRSARIVIKSGTTVQDRCKIIGNVILERGCILAPQVFISSGTHNAFDVPELTIREQDRIGQDRSLSQYNHIEEDCWIGYNVFVKPGVYIGRGAVIGANATILKDVAPYEVVVGHHKVVKKRLEFVPQSKLEFSNQKHRPYFYRGFGDKGQVLSQDNLIILVHMQNANEISLSGHGLNNISSIHTSIGGFNFKREIGDSGRLYEKSSSEIFINKHQIMENYVSLSIQYDTNRTVLIDSVEIN